MKDSDSHPTLEFDDVDSEGGTAEENKKYHKQREQGDKVVHGANQMVLIARTVVVFILIVAIGAVALAMNNWISTNELSTFKEQFHSDAIQIIESIEKTLTHNIDVADSFIVNMVSTAHETNQVWPFVTIPSFAVKAFHVLEQTKAFSINVYPVVTPTDRNKWENYTKANNEWIEESLNVEEDYLGKVNRLYRTVDYIHDVDEEQVEEPANAKFFLPLWQSAPTSANSSVPIYNLDSLSNNQDDSDSLESVFRTKNHVISDFTNLIHNETDKKELRRTGPYRDWMSLRVSQEDSSEPTSVVYMPVLNNADKSVRLESEDNKVVAVLSYHYMWKSLMEDILPSNSHGGVAVVFSEECDDGNEGYTFTYQVTGPQAIFLGEGDKHSPRYDNLGTSATIGEDSSGSSCTKKITVYPSREMEDEYRTNTASVFIGVTIIVFLFTSILFSVYDYLVTRHQRAVMNKALASGAIVASLFPEEVRNQLDQEFAKQQQREKQGSDATDIENSDNHSEQVADLFEDTTVMFADLAGFTSWSARKTPAQVFELLETVYKAFDNIAESRNVFKVETIGDVYLAVTGLPEPQKDHAVIMARFAGECLRKMQLLVEQLSNRLGPDTSELELRVGLHSGATTAGVLRGQKARFQLFGETVNTAAKMENTGLPGRIQISQSTADALIIEGKGHWFRAREQPAGFQNDALTQTYWIKDNVMAGDVESD